MDNDKSLIKWSGAAVGTVIVCFFLGYFILPRGRTDEPTQETAMAATPTPTPAPQPLVAEPVVTQRLALTDITEKKEAERRRLEEKQKQETLAAEKAARDAEAAAAEGNADGDGSITMTPDTGAVPPSDGGIPEPNGVPPGDAKPVREGAEGPPTPKVSVPPPTGDVVPAPERRSPDPATNDNLFRVRIGDPHASRGPADSLASELRGRGYQPIVLKTDRGFVVQIGAFRDRKGAEEKQKELAASGYDARIR